LNRGKFISRAHKKHHGKYNVRKKIVVWLVFMLVSSCFLSFCFGSLTSFSRIKAELNTSVNHTADIVLELAALDMMDIDKIIAITASNSIPVKKLENPAFSANELRILDSGEKLVVNTGFLYSRIVVKTNDTYLEISINRMENTFTTYITRTGIVLLLAALFSILLTFFSSGITLRPINELISATQEVAKGNFAVRLATVYHNDINRFISNFNMMVMELGQMEVLRNDFVSNVSHEFKTPLSSISGFAELLQKSELTAEQREYAEIIVYEANRLSKLSTNILRLSKLENQEIITEKVLFSLDEQLRRCLLILEKKWAAKNINLEIYLDKAAYYGNEELLEQVWINLIDNAIKFSGDGGEIIINCTETDEADEAGKKGVVVSVKDSGTGMEEHVQKRLFEKFYQGDSSHASEGNGLGMAMVKRIVDMCDGTIEVNSQKGFGSVFVVWLPLDSEE